MDKLEEAVDRLLMVAEWLDSAAQYQDRPGALGEHEANARVLREVHAALGTPEMTRLRQMELRMGKIAEFHVKYVDSHGGTWGDCNECGLTWPCPTYVWATTERDTVLYCWDPAEDEDVET